MLSNSKCRVLHVLPWVASGGVERRRKALAEFLPHPEFEQKVFCLDEVGPLADEIRALGTPVVTVGGGKLDQLRVYRQLAALIRDFRPDIIHGAVFEGVRMAVTVGRAMRVPLVISEETSHATNRSPMGHALFGACAFASHRCVAISPAVAEYLHEHSRVPWRKIVTISNGVPIPEPVDEADVLAARAELGFEDDDVVFVTVGRLYDDTHKRVSDLVRAIGVLAASDDPRAASVRLLVVGEGPIRSELESLSEHVGASSRVVFAGYRHDVDRLYEASDAFALASGREGFGLVVAEAMMHGLPTLTTRVGGIANIVDEGTTGECFPVGDTARIAELMMTFASDAERRDKVGRAGRERAQAEFSSQRYAHDVEGLYRNLLAEKRERRVTKSGR